MKNCKHLLLLALPLLITTSCITTKDVRYMQPSESLVINEEGLIPYNIPVYRITKNDILNLNIVTTPKGDAAQFYSSMNTSGSATAPSTNSIATGGGMMSSGGGNTGGNVVFYFNGLKVDANGDINVFGIGFIKAEGRTIAEISSEIQDKVNENFQEGKSEVRLNTNGITFYVLGDVETTGVTGEKVVHKNTLTITEALAISGGLNRTVDRKNIVIHRKLPEGIKKAIIDLTREDVMNSPYYYVQNGDEIYLNTRAKSLNGLGKDPIQTLTTGVSVITTALSIYLLLKNL
ncbi:MULTISPECIES: polysaccharide biosynthesis/export family protein [Chryseobacterium]|uniref:Protein involved in gliding motility EpsA n=1 Tax=Chryseobacterium gambrini TaxID=373672 RepID=A0A1N7QYF1_9FLAO|nr:MULTISPECIES: polysaccharide biosynthesis/export family protein [Chryseobacterium]MBL7882351.1 polysaccharide biosynthesis/export family protein [Chryseobacterium gambrini]MCQ4142331.1 polysaccharide biosynthesis/export family protein [Chryseobacterium sp. EO14]MCY1663649.1 polysaccharide biosynthesis/export family protein [Chryseobacterium sp. SL1]PTT73295.1 gliding motility protein [Chryseobacterium sp. HMWF001]PVV56912.1 gliding motility protein [Chryseobacterium sp. HMWF035]